jgi:hypothetical protein
MTAPLHERLSGMTDKELVTLAENARRLKSSNNSAQRQAAEDLWPHLETEMASRPQKAPPKSKAKAKPKGLAI